MRPQSLTPAETSLGHSCLSCWGTVTVLTWRGEEERPGPCRGSARKNEHQPLAINLWNCPISWGRGHLAYHSETSSNHTAKSLDAILSTCSSVLARSLTPHCALCPYRVEWSFALLIPGGWPCSYRLNPVAWCPSPHGRLRLGEYLPDQLSDSCNSKSDGGAEALPSQGWPRPLSASGSCHHKPGANRNQMWRLRGKALLFAFAQKLGARGRVLPGQLEREGEAAREEWGLIILETLVFIFPPGSLGSRGGQGQIPQESQLWSGLSEATCLCSPSDILKWFPSIGGPPKFLTMSAEGPHWVQWCQSRL